MILRYLQMHIADLEISSNAHTDLEISLSAPPME